MDMEFIRLGDFDREQYVSVMRKLLLHTDVNVNCLLEHGLMVF